MVLQTRQPVVRDRSTAGLHGRRPELAPVVQWPVRDETHPESADVESPDTVDRAQDVGDQYRFRSGRQLGHEDLVRQQPAVRSDLAPAEHGGRERR